MIISPITAHMTAVIHLLFDRQHPCEGGWEDIDGLCLRRCFLVTVGPISMKPEDWDEKS